jgi:mannose/cellobiose epimerase-like protein (N-acyl-D-glucosamine 2-epimerase family)
MTTQIRNSDLPQQIYDEKWIQFFTHPSGLFEERLNLSLEPIQMDLRLLSQARMIYASCSILEKSEANKDLVREKINLLDRYFFFAPSYIFSINPDLKPAQNFYDLYSLSFVLLALVRASEFCSEPLFLQKALQIQEFIANEMVHPKDGFFEALDSHLVPLAKIRRQNPHMHLLEACLAGYAVSKQDAFKAKALDILRLLETKFLCPSASDPQFLFLNEFFDEALRPHPDYGVEWEAGHHFEWIWLLQYAQDLAIVPPDYYQSLQKSLYQTANQYAYDRHYQGYFQTLRLDTVINSQKRIWILCEACKAHFIQGDFVALERDFLVLEKNYFIQYKNQNRIWKEICDEKFQSVTDYLPATSLYHLLSMLDFLTSKA